MRALLGLALAAVVACHGDRGARVTSSTGTGASGGGGSGATTSTATGPCTEAWVCSPWETDGHGDQATRGCVDANGCGTTDEQPAEEATLPGLDLDFFECKVEPILDRKCSMLGCHGTENGRRLRIYARGRKRLAGQMLANPACGAGSTPSEGCDGSTLCLCAAPHTAAEWRKNYDSARGFALDDQAKPFAAAKMDRSDLLAQPVVGGKPHAGIHLFAKGDAEYAILKSWLTGAKLGSPCATGVN